MFQLRKEHMQAIQAVAERAFPGRVIDHLRTNHRQDVQALSDDVLRARVDKGLKRAAAIGLTWESSLLTFVTLMFRIGPQFDEQPAIRKALREAPGNPDERMRELPHRVKVDDWEQARRSADEKAWERIG